MLAGLLSKGYREGMVCLIGSKIVENREKTNLPDGQYGVCNATPFQKRHEEEKRGTVYWCSTTLIYSFSACNSLVEMEKTYHIAF
jgi:hypothetical protein